MRIAMLVLFILCLAGCTSEYKWSGSTSTDPDTGVKTATVSYGDIDSRDAAAVRQQIEQDKLDASKTLDPYKNREGGQ